MERGLTSDYMTFHLITLFADSFTSYINESILARAQKEKKIAGVWVGTQGRIAATNPHFLDQSPHLLTPASKFSMVF